MGQAFYLGALQREAAEVGDGQRRRRIGTAHCSVEGGRATGLMPKEIEHCHECGAKKVIYRHRLNKGLVIGLRALYDAGGVAKLSALNLTVSQHNNFQKLQYWEFVTRAEKSRWHITTVGIRFLLTSVMAFQVVRTYRGKVLDWRSGDIRVYAGGVDPDYEIPKDYIRESENLTKSGQLFPEMA